MKRHMLGTMKLLMLVVMTHVGSSAALAQSRALEHSARGQGHGRGGRPAPLAQSPGNPVLTLEIHDGEYDSTGTADAPTPVCVDKVFDVTLTHSCSDEWVEIEALGATKVEGEWRGQGSTTVEITYILPGDKQITGECDSGYPGTVTGEIQVVLVIIGDVVRGAGLPNSVPPGESVNVDVDIIDSLDDTGHHMGFDVINGGGGNGTASVTDNETRTSSGTIEITGGNQNDVGKGARLKIRARMDSTGDESCTESSGFGVCAHPQNYDLTGGIGGLSYGIRVDHTWESDSGDKDPAHLDKCWMQERLFNFHKNTPPFYPIGANPPPSPQFRPAGGTSTDTHRYPAQLVRNYTHGTRTLDQDRRFRCQRGGSSWATVPNSGYHIEFEVFDDDPGPEVDWKIRTTKTPTTGSGSYGPSIEDIGCTPGSHGGRPGVALAWLVILACVVLTLRRGV